MTTYTFGCSWDSREHHWTVYGDAHHTGYTIDAQHTAKGEERNVVNAYNKEHYLRSPTELDLMGRMHSAYRDGDKHQLKSLVDKASKTFEGSKEVVELYREAAARL